MGDKRLGYELATSFGILEAVIAELSRRVVFVKHVDHAFLFGQGRMGVRLRKIGLTVLSLV